MIVDITLKPKSNFPKVVKENDQFTVYVRSVPHKGEANDEMLDLLADFFGVSRSRLEIVKGFKSKQKKVKIAHDG